MDPQTVHMLESGPLGGLGGGAGDHWSRHSYEASAAARAVAPSPDGSGSTFGWQMPSQGTGPPALQGVSLRGPRSTTGTAVCAGGSV